MRNAGRRTRVPGEWQSIRMFVPDLTFYLAMTVVDLLAVAFLLSKRTGRGSLTLAIGVFAGAAVAALLISAALNEVYGFRVFGFLRFAGLAGAMHAPILLAATALIFHRNVGLRVSTLGVASTLVLVATFAYRIEPYRLEITHHAMTGARLAGLQRPLTILQVADIQTDRIGAYERRVMREIAGLRADLIVFLGDYIQEKDAERRERLALEFNGLLRDADLHAPLGMYAVQGDCERREGWEALFRGTGVEILDRETREVALPGASLRLIGLDLEASRAGTPRELERIAGETGADRLEVYLGHSPDFADQLARRDQPFLALAGHTHGGQVRIPFWGAPITYSRLGRRMADAFARFGPGILSVSRGVGMERIEAPRVRLFCRPELRMITLLPPRTEPRGGWGEEMRIVQTDGRGDAGRRDVSFAWGREGTAP